MRFLLPPLVVLLLLLVDRPVRAQPGATPPASQALSPGAPPAPPWEPLPLGRTFGGGPPRPRDGALRVCSFEAPVCVHGEAADGALAMEVLREAEESCRFLRLQARLPAPEGDSGGGSRAVDLYLQPLGGPRIRLGFEAPTRFPRDRAPSYALLERRLTGCARATAVHRAMAAAHLAAVDGGEAGSSFATTSAYLAMAATGCHGEALAALDDAQARPSRPLLEPGAPDGEASPLLWWWLDSTLGESTPGALLTGLWYYSAQSTRLDMPRFQNVPDLITVLKRLALARKTTADALLLELAVARAFLGERDDGQHFAEAAWLGSVGRVRFEASWPHRSLPRRLAFTPLDPTGMVYSWVDLAGPSPPRKLGFHASWEHPVTMRWALVRVASDGQEISRMVLPHRRGVFEVDAIVEELETTAGLMIVGVNNGETSLDEPLRLDEAPYEPHGGTFHVFVP
jgi:hypothetical protein